MASVIIVGGGVIGCAVAERLSRDRGRHRVLLLERDRLGAHASGAAAGMLVSHAGGPELGRRSMALFPELVARVERASGMTVEFHPQETITPALTAAEERLLRRGPGRWLDTAQVTAEEPGLGPTVRGAIVRPEAQVVPARLVAALARTAAAQGAELREGAPVSRLLVRAGRLRGVQGPDGTIAADLVVVAAGPWSAILTSPVGVVLDVRPSRGQLVTLQPRGLALRRMLTWRGCYLVPKPDGTVMAGSTEEEVGFDARPTAEGVNQLLEFAIRAVPILGDAAVQGVWAALRPATSDGRPVVGRAAGLPNLILAAGHNRDGILLAPVTAEVVAETIGS
jgi:glycine oxidase